MAPSLVVLALVIAAPPAPGIWRVVSDDVRVTRQRWSLYCDERAPRVEPTKSGVELEVVVDGREWTAKGAKRRFGTATCEGRVPKLAAVDRSQDGDAVSFSCRSAAVTLGTESGRQTVTSSEHELSLEADLVHQFKSNGDDCTARLERRTVLQFVRPKEAAATEVAAVEPAPTPPPVDPCATPGAPVALTIEPRVVVVKVGEPPACFAVRATDARGCAAPSGGVKFTVDPTAGGAVSPDGCFTPAKVEEESAIAVVAALDTLDAAATVQVLPAGGEGRAQKSLETLAKTTKSVRVKEVIAEVTRGELVIRPLESAPPELPPLDDPGVPWGAVGGAAVAFVLGGLGLVVVQRRRKRMTEVATELQAKPVVVPTKGGGLQCPQCKFEFTKGEATVCPFDATPLVELDRDARQTMFIPVVGGMICPACQTRYPTKARFCGHDGTPLLPDFGPSEPPTS